MSNEILITLEVIPGGRKYPVKINTEDEELIREAVRQLRLKFNAYNQAFSEAELSDLDLMAMLAIDVATSHLRLERKNDVVPFTMKMQELNEKVKNYLKEQ